MRKLIIAFAGAAAVLGTVSCSDPLNVENQENPDVPRAFSTPSSVEQIIGTGYQLVFIGNEGSNAAIRPQLQNMAFENYASVANFGMALRGALPRLPISNVRGNQTQTEVYRDFSHLSRA